jgi:hypothetical protein
MINFDNYLSFTDNNILYKFSFSKDEYGRWVDVVVFEPGKSPSGSAWIHVIKEDGKIIWRSDDFLNITPKAKEHIAKCFKLKAFL